MKRLAFAPLLLFTVSGCTLYQSDGRKAMESGNGLNLIITNRFIAEARQHCDPYAHPRVSDLTASITLLERGAEPHLILTWGFDPVGAQWWLLAESANSGRMTSPVCRFEATAKDDLVARQEAYANLTRLYLFALRNLDQ